MDRRSMIWYSSVGVVAGFAGCVDLSGESEPESEVLVDTTLTQSRLFTEFLTPEQHVEVDVNVLGSGSIWLHVLDGVNTVSEQEITGEQTQEIDIDVEGIWYFGFGATAEHAEDEVFAGGDNPYDMPETEVRITIYGDQDSG